MKGIGERMIRAAKLDGTLYQEIKADRRAPVQAAIVVILSAMAAGIGVMTHDGVGGFFYQAMQTMVQWYGWVFFTYLVGTRLLQEPQTKIDLGATVRMISFASAPGIVSLLGVIPGLSSIVFGLALAWMLGAMAVAVKEAMNYTTTFRAVGACLLGWAAQYLFMGILLDLGARGPGT